MRDELFSDLHWIWSQVYLEHAVEHGWCDRDVADEITAHLVDAEIRFTRISSAVAVRACELSEYDPARHPFLGVLSEISDSSSTGEGVAGMLAGALAALSRPPHPQISASQASEALVRTIVARDDRGRVAAQLNALLDGAFGLDVVGAAAVRAQLRALNLL